MYLDSLLLYDMNIIICKPKSFEQYNLNSFTGFINYIQGEKERTYVYMKPILFSDVFTFYTLMFDM